MSNPLVYNIQTIFPSSRLLTQLSIFFLCWRSIFVFCFVICFCNTWLAHWKSLFQELCLSQNNGDLIMKHCHFDFSQTLYSCFNHGKCSFRSKNSSLLIFIEILLTYRKSLKPVKKPKKYGTSFFHLQCHYWWNKFSEKTGKNLFFCYY